MMYRTFSVIVLLIFLLQGCSLVRGIFGGEDQEAMKIELLDENSTRELMEHLKTAEGGVAGYVGGIMKAAEAVDKASAAEDRYKNTLAAIGEQAKTAAEDLQAVNEGLAGKAPGAATSMKRQTALATAGVSSMITKALANAMNDEGVVDELKAKEGMKRIIDTLGAEAEKLSPELFAALNLPGAISVLAVSEKGNLFKAPETYMNKIAVGKNIPNGVVDLDFTTEKNTVGQGHDFQVKILWMSENSLISGKGYWAKFRAKTINVNISKPHYKIDVNTNEHKSAEELNLNEIGVCDLTCDQDIAYELFQANPALGSFIIVDRVTNNTVAMGLLEKSLSETSWVDRYVEQRDKFWERSLITKSERSLKFS